MRLDKLLCQMEVGTRSQVKTYIRQGLVAVNGVLAKSGDLNVEESADLITFRGKELKYRQFYYYMLNKPRGVVSATRDNRADTVVELMGDRARADLFPVGRLDKDTEGLLLLTNDGALAHRLLAPKHHVDKTYIVTMEHSLTPEEIRTLEQGVDIGERHLTLPARVEPLEEKKILLTISEGKYHQVKRMLQAVGNRVTALKRTAFGGITLEEELQPGQYRELTEQEVAMLHGGEADT